MKRLALSLMLLASPAMAQDIVLTIPDALVPRVINAMAATYGYQDTIDGQANTETKAQFARRMLLLDLKEITINYEMQQERRNSNATLEAMKTTKAGELSF